jgi:hypothetical protein
MKTKPVKRYREPRYPAKLQVLSHPALLRQNLPPAWRTVPEMAGAMALCLAANTATCNAQGAPGGSTNAAVAIVAPVFEHGEGRGATGCIVVSPPAFLSEEEAWQVIEMELSRHGVNASEKKFEVRGVMIPVLRERWKRQDKKAKTMVAEPIGWSAPFRADRVDSKKQIVVEFVSKEEYHVLGGPLRSSSVQHYEFKEVARSLAEQVKAQAKDKIYLGVLYDPALHSDYEPGRTVADMEQACTATVAESKRLLRLQVQDFVKWLQAQGAI